ncbi:hypothetical protein [Mycobacterium servetii]|uniref:Integral membrane protein n=1 Tax=Mycobacterium servetii TaxID=3237418 RepID=A0ABV4C7U9_9MYCO
MSTFNGLPAHILLNHFVVVLAPLTAVLAILCALWPAARRRLIWLVVLLAVATVALTPVTAGAGAWLAARVRAAPAAVPVLAAHEQLGSTFIYIVAALLATVALLAAVHVRQTRGTAVSLVAQSVVGVLVVVAAAATLIQTYRIGDSGARAAWGTVSSATP